MANILVVDDEVGIRELLSDILSDEGYNVSTAEDARSARQQVTTHSFDLILLDIPTASRCSKNGGPARPLIAR